MYPKSRGDPPPCSVASQYANYQFTGRLNKIIFKLILENSLKKEMPIKQVFFICSLILMKFPFFYSLKKHNLFTSKIK